QVNFSNSGVNSTLNGAGLNQPTDSAVDSSGHRLFVSDLMNSRVLVYNLAADNSLEDRAADYVLGQPDFSTSSIGWGSAEMNGPTGLAYDETNGRLFVADFGNSRVLVFDLSGGITNGMD